MTLDKEAIVLYQGSRQYWDFYGDYLKTNYEKDFNFFYIEPNTPLNAISETSYSFYIKPKNVMASNPSTLLEKFNMADIKPILFDVKDLNI
jgi:hypothetical protein